MDEDSKESPKASDVPKVEAKWSFDLAKLKKHVSGEDELQVIIRGHLYVEHVLIEFLTEALPKPDEIDLRRIPYFMKIDLCVALGIAGKALAPVMNKLNAFRNRVAHNLNYEFTEKDKIDFYNCFPKMGQQLVLANGTKDKTFPLAEIEFAHMIRVIIVMLDLDRQQYVEWKKSRDAAEANLVKALAELDEFERAEKAKGEHKDDKQEA